MAGGGVQGQPPCGRADEVTVPGSVMEAEGNGEGIMEGVEKARRVAGPGVQVGKSSTDIAAPVSAPPESERCCSRAGRIVAAETTLSAAAPLPKLHSS